LKKLGCIISSAENVSKALQLLQENKYDLVISDLGLPDGNGTYIIETIKGNKKHLNHTTPFFALTANTPEEQFKDIHEKGFEDVIQKPLEAEKAKELISNYVLTKKNNEPTKAVIDLEAAKALLGDNKELAEK
jgi:CheY-like chemotaxis protein